MNPKVLIAAPIGGLKQYSINLFFEWIALQTYDNFDVCLCTNGDNARNLTEMNRQVEITHRSGIKKIIPLTLIHSEELTVIQKITYSREKIRRYAVKHGYDYIFFLDSDTIPANRDAIQQLLKWNVDCISGLYFYKESTQPVVIDDETYTNITMSKVLDLVKNNTICKAWGFGFGCLLLSRKAFEHNEFDYALFGEERTDDFGYCHVLEQSGIDRWFYPYVLCKHFGDENKPKDLHVGKFKIDVLQKKDD